MTDPQTDAPDTDYATGWRPSPGDHVAGKIIDISATDGGYGLYPILTLDVGGGEVAVHAFHTVLRRELARRRPQVGDELEITYLGKHRGKAGTQGYDGYRVKSNRDAAGYDWDLELSDEMRSQSVPIEPAPVPRFEGEPAAHDPQPVPVDDSEVPF